jgi:crossover junction endodeoxyribonuclease RusA
MKNPGHGPLVRAVSRGGLCIVLPLPPRVLSPNARAHWATKARATKLYRQAACVEAVLVAGPPAVPWETATVLLRFFFRTRARRDRDNLLASMKAAFDGLADAGVVRDDSGLTYMPVEVVTGVPAADQRVELLISSG